MIRELYMEELRNALELIWNTFIEFEAPEYSNEGIQEFKNYIEFKDIKEKVIKSELLMWGCFDNNKIIGVIATSKKPCHINMLFVDREYHKQGIASRLFNKALEHYKANTEYSEMTVNSSPYAQDFYRKIGFKDTDKEKTINGIRFIPMKYEF